MSANYRYCGLTLASDWPLPELPAVAADAAPDLEIVTGEVAERLADEVRRTASFAHNGREALWWLAGVGRFHVAAGGRRITIHPATGADVASVRLMLLHPVFALASVLRGDWMLNAAAVEAGGEVSAFIGPSASGKSTATALLLKRGFRLVSDSLLRVTLTPDGRLLAHPQAPWLQLWPDAMAQLGLTNGRSSPVRPGLPLLRLEQPDIDTALPLSRLGLLRAALGNDPEHFLPNRHAGKLGFETIVAYTSGRTWLHELAERQTLFRWAARLTAKARIERLEASRGWSETEAFAAHLARWCRCGKTPFTPEDELVEP